MVKLPAEEIVVGRAEQLCTAAVGSRDGGGESSGESKISALSDISKSPSLSLWICFFADFKVTPL